MKIKYLVCSALALAAVSGSASAYTPSQDVLVIKSQEGPGLKFCTADQRWSGMNVAQLTQLCKRSCDRMAPEERAELQAFISCMKHKKG